MENIPTSEIVQESIRLELNVAELYATFNQMFPADAEFWWTLHLEEKRHASIIRSAGDSFFSRGESPGPLLAGSAKELKEANKHLEQLRSKFQNTPPSRREALETAMEIEQLAGERHYDRFMKKVPENPIETVFQQLNKDNKDHWNRLKDRLTHHCLDT